MDELLNQALLDTTLLDLKLTTRKRPKNLLLGTYFPNIAGILCPPLWGTRLFPLAAKQEKLHFIAAADGKLDHFDGQPDQFYLEDIQKIMAKTFRSWDTQPNFEYCPDLRSANLAYFWRNKFPFAIQKFEERCYTIKDKDPGTFQPGTVRTENSPAPTPAHPERTLGSTIVATTAARPKADPRRSEETIRLANVSNHGKLLAFSIKLSNLVASS